MSVTDASAVEGDDLEFVISLSHAAETDIEIVYITLNGSAGSADYETGNDIDTIKAGATEFTVRIPTRTDTLSEGPEHIRFELAGIFADTELADGDAIGTITDN